MAVPQLCYPLDYPDVASAVAGARRVSSSVDVLKVGLELFVEAGPSVVRALAEFGKPIFLDLKLHDIPETVHRAVLRACDMGVSYLTVHASGGTHMLSAAQDAVVKSGTSLTLLGVTVLTSMDADELSRTGVARPPAEQALHLAQLGHAAGLRGFVCSPQEVAHLRHALGPDAVLVTPGVRPVGIDSGDQKRVATPSSAVQAGSSMLVVGRPIRDAIEPNLAAQAIRAEMLGAVSEQLG